LSTQKKGHPRTRSGPRVHQSLSHAGQRGQPVHENRAVSAAKQGPCVQRSELPGQAERYRGGLLHTGSNNRWRQQQRGSNREGLVYGLPRHKTCAAVLLCLRESLLSNGCYIHAGMARPKSCRKEDILANVRCLETWARVYIQPNTHTLCACTQHEH